MNDKEKNEIVESVPKANLKNIAKIFGIAVLTVTIGRVLLFLFFFLFFYVFAFHH